ncbi:maleylpyruvate isomerase family mycothiol-dependent enzyme [Streptomyces sp. 8K308]|uniref:maleylpyruvate isomerase family mycothiol-dependent enzyme n=1 Tax=Streptomyces sp. 8K308 TaxID=2530388 RepID=UPI001052F12C|nr:maleylpyruvate isomerase family mycothiol-dependent enzyme [Streptomyces sp. 8K308]TDC26829.1 maleylpyruvate isomerase family mycothiol-dependent enzyme [Streptomyces sp. 8K308]
MTGPTADLAGLNDATDRLVADVATLDDAAVAGSSHLPGWTRGHVLAHLARNADALVNVFQGRPMYPSLEARNADIERDAPRPLAVHLADLRDSADRLATAAAGLTDDEWRAVVTLRDGQRDAAAVIPLRRWVEIELHGIDLDIGRTIASLSSAFLDRAPDYLARRLADHPAVPPLELRAEDGRSWRTGRAGAEPQVVVGTTAALVGWLSGRTAGSGLTTAEPLPELPGL